MDKLNMHTPNGVDRNIELIGKLFPNVLTERLGEDGKPERAIDFDALRQELSKSIVEGPDERYQFTWPDKRKSVLLANSPIAATLRPCREDSVNFDSTENLYIEGDNLDVLKLLQETYLGKIKMIYIDPPYNTGNDFVYEDDFAQSAGEFLERDGQYDAQGNRLVQNTDSNGRFHTDWLNMIYPRLKLAKDLLTDDGVIFISIDDNEIHNLRKCLDELFGYNQFVAQITLLCNPKGRSQDKYVANCHEYILIYSKKALKNGSFSIPKSDDDIKNDYSLIDSNGCCYRELELRNTHRDFGKFNRQNLWYPIYIKPSGEVTLNYQSEYYEVFPIWDDGYEGCWTWGKEKASSDAHLLVGKKVNGKWKIYRKAYAYCDIQAPLKQVKSIWTDKLFFTEKGQIFFSSLFDSKEKIFQAPKSVHMIRQCIQMSQSQDALILDFFSGSGTTAHAVMQQNAEDGGNRKFIMVQLPEACPEDGEAYKAGYKTICEIGKERIRRAGAKIASENATTAAGLDIGFRVLKLDSTNMKDVYYSPAATSQDVLFDRASNIKDGRGPEDLLFQVMLELGVLLSSNITETVIAGKKIFNVADNFLIACFDEEISDDVVTAIAQQKPCYAVLRDSSLKSDSVAANFEQIFATFSPDTVRRIL
ncbi:site-specific DNA-methyltransferase [Oligosphaera ethanolica]|uniref:site-specific DNA-methyltransferase (adenine-specific) n=1 Tax=Oligosphaera ethanolica TaxID=760260 RepID=A0AAE3VK51_9BACT|nr:site-specific DNA-methyltransferase [Oligosphaera ethanolica]MDQ0291900.1 adenine-specific DNA-methyltransferase [Oligosphaera ethanolica]